MEKVNIYYDDIYEIENFLSDEYIDFFLSFINLDSDDGWNYSNQGQIYYPLDYDNLPDHYLEYVDKVQGKIVDCFVNVSSFMKIFFVKRLKIDESMPSHKDFGTYGKDNIAYGVTMYLNDDFSGGELYYSNLDIKIKPKRGSLIIHKSTYEHEVLPVTDGKRYSMTCSILGDENTKVKIK